METNKVIMSANRQQLLEQEEKIHLLLMEKKEKNLLRCKLESLRELDRWSCSSENSPSF